MTSFRKYSVASNRSSKPLFSRQNLLQVSALGKMAGERRRGGSLNSRGRRPPSFRYSLRSSQSASYESSMYQKDELSITSSDIKDNRHSHIGGCQHEQMAREGDGYSSSRPSCSHVGGHQHQRMSQDSPVAANSTFERVECCFTVSCIEEGLIQDGAANHNLPQHINNTEEGKKAAGFDICPRKTTAPVKRNPSLLSKNKEKQKEQEKRKEQEWMEKGLQIKELRPGMILLKNYLSHSEQVEIIRECHKLGLGQGGFYQPGYSGTKLRFHMMYLGRDWDPETRFYGECHRPGLVRGFYQPGCSDGMKLPFHMMCLGKDWDPETKLYRGRRSVDDAEPPSIPDGFKTMVKRSLQDSHDFIRQNSKVRPVEDVLPNMKPDICIVHFYMDKGTLGLHQDKDESLDSLCKGLPIVSLSVGDSADFLYRDDRDADRVKTVKLESGDVLIFGGESRHIFHGVSSIFPGTAPKPLVDETGLRLGRLNLTFRQKEQEQAPYDSSVFQKDESSIPTYGINDNGHSCLGGHWQERKVGGESRDRYSSSRPRCSPFAQDSTNSRKSASYEGQNDEPSSATSDDDDIGHSHMGGHEHERKVGEGSQDYLNSHKCASYDSSMFRKDEPSISTSDIKDNGHSHISGGWHEQMVREESQDRYSSSRLRRSPYAQDSPDSRKSVVQMFQDMTLDEGNEDGNSSDITSYNGQKDEPSSATSDVNDNERSHTGGLRHERKLGEGSHDRYSNSRPRRTQYSPNSHKSGLFPRGSRPQRIGTSHSSAGNADSRSHVRGPQHRQMPRDSAVAANSTFEPVDCCYTLSWIEKGLIQDGAGNCNPPQQIESTEKGKETGFDICPMKTTAPMKLNPSLLSKNREKRKEQEKQEHMDKGLEIEELRRGMIILKRYLGHSEQVEIIRACRELGLGKGGFYQPGYSDGTKLHLQMMCLGRDWDPEKKYRDRQSVDNAEPPSIPDRFKKMVERSLQDSHDFIRQNLKAVIPNMKPDICIVNFYTDTGKLGFHQDKDESERSLNKQLPVVSFSIGDSAEFCYGDDRDSDKAKKVTLESGDVLIFGGESRHIYHGVSSILAGTAPTRLLEETDLRTGRLNLTFRQY